MTIYLEADYLDRHSHPTGQGSRSWRVTALCSPSPWRSGCLTSCRKKIDKMRAASRKSTVINERRINQSIDQSINQSIQQSSDTVSTPTPNTGINQSIETTRWTTTKVLPSLIQPHLLCISSRNALAKALPTTWAPITINCARYLPWRHTKDSE